MTDFNFPTEYLKLCERCKDLQSSGAGHYEALARDKMVRWLVDKGVYPKLARIDTRMYLVRIAFADVGQYVHGLTLTEALTKACNAVLDKQEVAA